MTTIKTVNGVDRNITPRPNPNAAREKAAFPSSWQKGYSKFGRPLESPSERLGFHNIVNDGAWSGRRCFIVGGGPSLEGFDWSLLDGELVIVANHGFQLCNPSIIVSCDSEFMNWVDGNRDHGNGFCSPEMNKRFWNLKCLRAIVDAPGLKKDALVKIKKSSVGLNLLRFAGNDGFSKSLHEGVVCGRNSGFAALNLAVLLDASPIYLLGLDMQHRPGDNKAHYYDKGKPYRPNDNYKEFYCDYFNKVAPEIEEGGNKVINLSPDSALECFEKGEFPEPLTRPMYVSYYTLDTPYAQEVENLTTSLLQHGLAYDLWALPSLGTWEANCSMISTVCREAMEKYPNRPIVFLPADCIVRQWPEVLEDTMPDDVDFAVHYGRFFPGHPKILNTSCLYFAPTEKAFELVTEWERRCRLDRARWDQDVLKEIIDEDTWGGKWFHLPGTYCKVYDNFRQENAGEPPVIEAFIASRRYKKLINKGVRS